jgi:hypothetical protein
MSIRAVGSTGILVLVLNCPKKIIGILVLVPIPIPEVSGTGIGTDTKIGENNGNRYSGKSTNIGTFTKIG